MAQRKWFRISGLIEQDVLSFCDNDCAEAYAKSHAHIFNGSGEGEYDMPFVEAWSDMDGEPWPCESCRDGLVILGPGSWDI